MVIVLLLVWGCNPTEKYKNTPANRDKLKAGMTQAGVRRLLGDPMDYERGLLAMRSDDADVIRAHNAAKREGDTQWHLYADEVDKLGKIRWTYGLEDTKRTATSGKQSVNYSVTKLYTVIINAQADSVEYFGWMDWIYESL